MRNHSVNGPYAGSTAIHPFAEMCCWPGCEASIGEIHVPLCERHLVKAYRIYRASHLWLIDEAAENAIDRAFTKISGRKVEPRDSDPEGVVYFIRLGDCIKIGFTTNLHQRLLDLPHEEVLGTVPGRFADEKRCHAAFRHLRVAGREWFRAESELLDFIADVTTG